MSMAGNCVEIGLVTYINGSEVCLWLMKAREEKLFSAMVKEDMLKFGIWIHVSKADLETSQISYIILVDIPPVKASTWACISGVGKTVSVETRIVFPPVEWAEENDYEWFAYSFEFGRVGNFAFNKLLKLNSYQVRRDVVYKAVLIRIPSSKLGRCVMDTFGSLWSILPQVLVLCDDQNGSDKRPWSLPSSAYLSPIRSRSSNNIVGLATCDTLESKVCNSPSHNVVEEVSESLDSSNDCIPAIAGSYMDQSNYGLCTQPVVYLGVVILREPQYSIIWGKEHGFVAVCATADLVLEPSNWVEYDCIKTDTELDISYLAINCVLSKQKPLVVETHENSIICHTIIHIPDEMKVQTDAGGTYFIMVCDILGDVLVPDIPIVHRCIRKNKLKAKVLVKYDKKWPCTLFAVHENAMLKIIDWKEASNECKFIPEMNCSSNLKTTQCGSDRSQFLDTDRNIVEASVLQKELKNETSDENEVLVEDLSSPDPDNNLASDLPLTVGITYQCSSDNNPVSIAGNIGEVTEVRKQIKMITYEEKTGPSESSYAATSATRKKLLDRENFDWLQLKKYTVGMKILTLPVTILVKLTSTYGILWHVNRKLIIVPAEYLSNSVKLGSWMKAKVSPLDTAVMDLPYHFIVVRPLEEIESKLMIRKIKDVLQVRVHLEPGVESYVNMDGKSYLQKNSELGLVFIPSERIPQKYLMKRFQTWVTFMSSGLDSEPVWMVTRRQKLIEVDKNGNELPDKSGITIRLTGVTATNDDDAVVESDDSSVEGVPDIDNEKFDNCSPASEL